MVASLVFAFTSLVAGETCPAPVDVEARVRAILHLAPEQQLSEGFVVERHEAGLYVELRSADSTLIGQRTLPVEGSCDELAQAAAVVLSAWLSDAHPDFAGALPPAPEPAPAPAPEPEPEPEPILVPTSAPAPAASPVPAPRVARPRRFKLGVGVGAELAVGAGAELSGESIAPSALVVLGFVPVAGGWGVSSLLGATSSRQLPLGPGQVAWRRWPLGIGPSFRAVTQKLGFELSAGPTLAWLHLDGSNFERSSARDGVEPGGFLQLCAESTGARWGLFGAATAQYYPRDSGAYATSPEEQWLAPVPRFSVGLSVGAWLMP